MALAPASAIPLDPPVITTTLPSSLPTFSPFGDYLAGEVKHLVKAGKQCEGVHDRLINTGPGEAFELAGNRVDGRAGFEVDPHGRFSARQDRGRRPAPHGAQSTTSGH